MTSHRNYIDLVSNEFTRLSSQVKKNIIFAIFFANFFLTCAAQKVKIIEFGWDYPDIIQLANHLPSMQNAPFDGICFSLQRNIMEAFDTTFKQDDYFEFGRLQSLMWGKYSDNFIILRGFSKTGGNWFDDKAWVNISNNMSKLSKAMQIGNIKGILFDPEYYYEDKLFNPWTFSSQQYPGKTLSEVQNKVKERGDQFITSLQKQKSSFTFISLWIASLIAEERKYTPLDKTRHILLISFIEGILQNKNENVRIADGNEYAYWNTIPSQFLEARSFLRGTMVDLLQSEKAKEEAKNIEVAQPVFYDGLIGTAPSFDKGLKSDIKWKWLDENIKYALASADHYVWFYSERLNWWKGSINDTILTVLNKNKSEFENDTLKLKYTYKNSFINNIGYDNINSGKGFYNAFNTFNKSKYKAAFDFEWKAGLQKLNIEFQKRLPTATYIYLNGQLMKKFLPSNLNTTIGLHGFTKGRLVILNKYSDKIESSAIYVLN